MKVSAVLTVFALKYCLFFYALIQEVKTQCNSVCDYQPDPIGFATCSSRSLTGIPSECSAATYLDMRRNELHYLDETSLTGFDNLLYIYLERNNIRNITPRAFAACSLLRQIYLQHNPLVIIVDNAFFGLSGLRELYLNSANLQRLQPNAFAGLSSIERLYLGNNTLTTLPRTVFHDLRTLKILILSNNRLQPLHRDQFQGLTQLTHLDLQHNRITLLGDGLFRGLPGGLLSLKTLNLSNNAISEIQRGAFDFTITANLEELDLSNNGIVSVINMPAQLVDIKNVFFAGNPMSCDCDNLLLMEWYERHNSSLDTNRRNIICHGPGQLTDIRMENVSKDVIETCKRAPTSKEYLEMESIGLTTTSLKYKLDRVSVGSDKENDEIAIAQPSQNIDKEDDNLFMFVGIAAVAVCLIVIIIGTIIMCKWFGVKNRHSQVPQEDRPPTIPGLQITENPLQEHADESELATDVDDDEVYELVSTMPDFARRRSRKISERSVDSAYSEGSTPDSIDYPPPNYPPPPPPPHQTFSGYIPVFQSKNGEVYLCTRCPHDSLANSGQPMLMHSVSVPSHCSDLGNRPHSKSQPPPLLRQKSFPESYHHSTHYIPTQACIMNQTPSQNHEEPPIYANPAKCRRISDSIVQTQTQVPEETSSYRHQDSPQDSPPIPLQTDIADYTQIDLSSYPSTNPFANPVVV